MYQYDGILGKNFNNDSFTFVWYFSFPGFNYKAMYLLLLFAIFCNVFALLRIYINKNLMDFSSSSLNSD